MIVPLENNLAKVYRIADIFPIIDISVPIMTTFGSLKANLVKAATAIDDMDLLIVSIANSYNLTLVTNNEKHFRRIELLKIDNWAK